MTLKQIWTGTSNWLRINRLASMFESEPDVDEEGLLQDAEPGDPQNDDQGEGKYMVKTVPHTERRDAMEKLQEGFNDLLKQLDGINSHLNRQVSQHQELMTRLEKLPEWMQAFPEALDGQKQATEKLLDELRASSAKQEQFADVVGKIPAETARQTDALAAINHQLAASADTDVQMVENLGNLGEMFGRLNQNTESQTDGIRQMNRTFAVSDRHLKYVVSKQNKRFLWALVGSMSLCFTAILVLGGIIIYLNR